MGMSDFPTHWSDVRREYARTGLHERDLDPNPIRQFEAWLSDAVGRNLTEATAMTLATATPDGRPSARIVLLKHVDDDGLVFFTNYDSDKGRELAANPQAALLLYWAELERQVRVHGGVNKVPRGQTEAYFQTRPLGARLSAWASAQSRVIPSREDLERRVDELRAEFGEHVPCPPNWGGYVLRPDTFEFWQGRLDRLHDRLRYRRQPDGSWLIDRLAP